jgi:hypothetical protein
MIEKISKAVKTHSFKTSAAGIAATASGLGAVLEIASNMSIQVATGALAISPQATGVTLVLLVIREIANGLIGWFARDNNITSEQANGPAKTK